MKKFLYSAIAVAVLSSVSVSVSAKEQKKDLVQIQPTGIKMEFGREAIVQNPLKDKRIANSPAKSTALYSSYYCEGSDWTKDDEGNLSFEEVNWEMMAGTLNGVNVLLDVIPNPLLSQGIDGLVVAYTQIGNKIRIEPQPVLNVSASTFDLWICNNFDEQGVIEFYVNDEGYIFPDEDLNEVFYLAVEKGEKWDYLEEHVLGQLQQTDVELTAVNAPTSDALMWGINPGGWVHVNVTDAKVTANFFDSTIFIEDEGAGLTILTDDYWVSDWFEEGNLLTGSMTGQWIIAEGSIMPSLYIDDEDYLSLSDPVKTDVSKGVETPTLDALLDMNNVNRLVTITNTDATPIKYVDGSLTIFGIIPVKNTVDEEDYLAPENIESVTGIMYLSGQQEFWILPRHKEDIVEAEATKIDSCIMDEISDGPIFNLSGQKVSNGYKGIVIKNGKKVLVK